MSFLKQYGTSAKGNDRLLKSYGGNAGSSPMARQKYASGGAVKSKDGNPSLSEGMAAADGAPAKPSLARPGRKMAGKGKDAGKKGTTVNIVIAGKGPDAGPPPMKEPPMPPPGAGPGGPPMPPGPPMRATGGAVGRFARGGRIANLGKYAHGGKVKRADGGPANPGEVSDAESSKYLRKKASDERSEAGSAVAKGAGQAILGGLLRSGNKATKAFAGPIERGIGKTLEYGNFGSAALNAKESMDKTSDSKRHDAEADKFEKKDGGRACRAEGGPVMGLHMKGKTVGSGGGLGRLAKMKKYGA